MQNLRGEGIFEENKIQICLAVLSQCLILEYLNLSILSHWEEALWQI